VPFYDSYMIQSAPTFAIAAREAKLEAVVRLAVILELDKHAGKQYRKWRADGVAALVSLIGASAGPTCNQQPDRICLRSQSPDCLSRDTLDIKPGTVLEI
jgi:hypothetical protein